MSRKLSSAVLALGLAATGFLTACSGGGDVAAFCEIANDSTSFPETAADFEALAKKMKDAAPSDIKADVDTYLDASIEAMKALESGDLAALDKINGEDITAAGERVETYVAENCKA